MSEFFIKTLAAIFAGHLVIFIHLAKAYGRGRWMFAVVLIFLFMAACPLFFFKLGFRGGVFESLMWVFNIWLAFCVIALVLLLLADLLRLLALLLKWIFGGRRKTWWRRKPFFTFRKQISLILLCAVALVGYSFYEARDIRAVHYTLKSDKPAFKRFMAARTQIDPDTGARDGAKSEESRVFRLVFVSDIHLNVWIREKMLARIAECIQEERPDMILLGGDIVDAPMQGRDAELALLRELRAPYGKFAVLGNHELTHGVDNALSFMTTAGFSVLRQQQAEVGGLSVIGVDDPRIATAEKTDRANPMPLLRGADAEKFIILLDHRPWLPGERLGLFDLQLSGHSHGGQIWPLNHLMERIYGTPLGLSFHEPDGASATGTSGRRSALMASVGAGFAKMPMRFLVPPEVVVVDLIPE